MKVVETALDQININIRLRDPSDEKVNELADSISQVGLLSPIGIDTSNNLIFGMHQEERVCASILMSILDTVYHHTMTR